jgi:large repetitive protein
MSSEFFFSAAVMRGVLGALVGAMLFLLLGCNVGGKTTVLTLQTTPTSIAASSAIVFTATISHNNGQFEGATWTLSSNGLPCSPACGTLGTPTNSGSQGNGDTATVPYNAPASPPMPNSVTITATSVENPSSSGSDTFTITAATAGTLTVQTFSLPQGTVGAAYPSTTLQATGGISPYSWFVDSGSLPAGLSLSTDGVISGTPTAAATFNFDVTVQDSTQAIASSPETIAVVTANGNACGSPGGNESLLKGQYAFLLQGLDSNNLPDVAAGTFTADGAGNISAGEEDLNLSAVGAVSTQSITAANNSYTVGSDNRGCLALATSAGTSVFRLALGSITSGVAAKGSLVEFDATYSAGVMRLQDSSAFNTAAINGNYAFGFDSPIPGYFATVGSFSVSAGTVSSGALDVNVLGNVDSTGVSGTPSNPVTFTGSDTVDAEGRATFSFASAINQVNGICYVVSAAELYCVSSDPQGVNPAFAGKILQQSGAPFSLASVSGNLVRYQDGIASTGIGVKAEIALVQADGAGNFSQAAVANDGGTYDNGLSASGTYAVDGNGRLTIPGNGPAPLFYLVAPNQAFAMSTDPIVSFGFMEGQIGTSFTNASLTGNYFFGQVVPSASGGQFQTGEEALDGAGNLSGTADTSRPGGLVYPAQSLAGGSYSISSTGFGTIMWSGTLYNAFYVISPTKWVTIDTVGTAPELQVAEQ